MSMLTLIFISFFGLVLRFGFIYAYPILQPEGTHAYDAACTEIFSGHGYEMHARIVYLLYTKLNYILFGQQQFLIVLGNIIMSTLTIFLIGVLAARVLSKEKFAYLAAFLTAVNPIFIFWVGYIFPESMFLLLFTISLILVFAYQKNPNRLKLAALICLSLVLIFTRAHGLLVAPLIWVWLIVGIYETQIARWYARNRLNKTILFICMVGMAVLVFSLTFGTIINIHRPIEKRTPPFTWLMGGHEPQNDMHIRLAYQTQSWIVRKENEPLIMKDVNSFKEQLRVALVKAKFFWIPVRETFSLRHKLLNLFIYGFLYLLSVFGFILLWKKRKDFMIFSILLFFLFTLAAIVCFPDPEGRYRLPCDLLLIIIASEAIGRFAHFLKTKFSKMPIQ